MRADRGSYIVTTYMKRNRKNENEKKEKKMKKKIGKKQTTFI